MSDNILLSVPNVNSLVQKNSTHRNPIIFRKLSNNENFKLHRFLDLRSKCLYSSINHMISYVTYWLNARLIQKYTKYGYISSNTRGERFRCYISIENRMQKICIGYKDMWMLCWKSKSGKWLEGRWKKCYEKNLIIMKKNHIFLAILFYLRYTRWEKRTTL